MEARLLRKPHEKLLYSLPFLLSFSPRPMLLAYHTLYRTEYVFLIKIKDLLVSLESFSTIDNILGWPGRVVRFSKTPDSPRPLIRSLPILLVGMKNGTVILENSWFIPLKVNHSHTSDATPIYLLKGKENKYPYKDLYMNSLAVLQVKHRATLRPRSSAPRHTPLVHCYSCQNKIPETDWLPRRNVFLTALEAGIEMIRVLVGPVSSEASLWHADRFFSPCPSGGVSSEGLHPSCLSSSQDTTHWIPAPS